MTTDRLVKDGKLAVSGAEFAPVILAPELGPDPDAVEIMHGTITVRLDAAT